MNTFYVEGSRYEINTEKDLTDLYGAPYYRNKFYVVILLDKYNGHEQMERIIRGEFRHRLVISFSWDQFKYAEKSRYYFKTIIGQPCKASISSSKTSVTGLLVQSFVFWHEKEEGQMVLYYSARGKEKKTNLLEFVNSQ